MNGYTYFPQEYLSQDFDSISDEELLSQSTLTIHLCIFQIKNNISQIQYKSMQAYKEKIPYIAFHLEKQNQEYSFPTISKYQSTSYQEFASDCYMHLIQMYNLEQSSPPQGEVNTTVTIDEQPISSPLLGFFIYNSQIIVLVDYNELLTPFNPPKHFPETQKLAIVDEFIRVRSIHSTPINMFAYNTITLCPFVRLIYSNGIVAPYPIRFYHAILTSNDESSPTNQGTLENVLEQDILESNPENSIITNEQTSEHPIFGQLYLFTDKPVVSGEDELYLRYACYLSKARYFDDIQKELNLELPANSSQYIREEKLIQKIINHIQKVSLELGLVKKNIAPPKTDPTKEENETQLTDILTDISTLHFIIDDINVCGLKYDVQFAYY